MKLTPEETRRVRKFAITMAIAFAALGGLLFWLDKDTAALVLGCVGAGFLVVGLPFPGLLVPVEWAWGKFAHALGWLNTRILLSVVFYVMMVPVGLFMKLIRRDPLDRRIDRAAATYWHTAPAASTDAARYERPY